MTAANLTADIRALLDSDLFEESNRLILADALEESGEDKAASWLRHEAKATFEQLETANGRRRTRTVSPEEIVESVRKILTPGCAFVETTCNGGHVANSYGYKAEQTTVLLVLRSDGTVRVGVAVANASKGASLYSPFGLRANSKPEQFAAWANNAN